MINQPTIHHIYNIIYLGSFLFSLVDDILAVDSPDGDEVGDGVLVWPVLLEAVPAPVSHTAPTTGAVAGDGASSAPA